MAGQAVRAVVRESKPARRGLTPPTCPGCCVSEPATVIAGALLLLPFGASTLRMLRKREVA